MTTVLKSILNSIKIESLVVKCEKYAHAKLCNALFSTVVSIFRPYSSKKMQILQPTYVISHACSHPPEGENWSGNRNKSCKCKQVIWRQQVFAPIFSTYIWSMDNDNVPICFFYFFSVMKSCIIFWNLTSNLLPSKSISFKSSAALELKKRQNSICFSTL